MRNRALITSVGRKVSLVQAFKSAGWEVHGKDNDKHAAGLKFCDGFFTGSLDDYDLIVPTRDAEIADFSSFPGVASRETVQRCVDKFEFYKWCKVNGFRTPEVNFVKPRISKSGKETECVWQELIEGEEYSIDVFADFDGQVISIVPRKRERILSGESSVTTTVRNQTLIDGALKLTNSLRLVGHNVLQCFLAGEPIWTDVNCRFGGASAVSIEAGCKSPHWLLKLINGQKVEPCIGDYKILTGYSYTGWHFEN